MKRIVILMTLVALLIQPALGLIPVAQAQGPDGEGEPEPGGMPGYPAPAKPIPHHEPGHLSRAGSYRTQVERENELGALEVVEISGVDAMAADGIDPLAGNYSLVNWDQILLSWYDGNLLDWQSLKYDNGFPPPGQEDSEPYVDESVRYNDITAADLNGDGQAEKIIVYIEEGGGLSDDKLIIQTSEMKGYLRATSAPAAVAHHSDGRIDLVVRGYDDALWHHDGYTWNNQSATNSPALLSGPAMAARGGGDFDVFVISADNQIYRGSFDGITWSGWILIDGQDIWPALDAWCGPTPELPAPAVVARGNKLDLFRLGPDNTLRWLHSGDGITWGAWQNLGGMISTGLGVVSQNEDHMQVYARGVDETLWYLTYDNGSWGSWQRVTETMDGGVTIASAPAVLSPDEVYVRGSDNHLWRYDGSSWTDLGGELASGVAVTTGSPKKFFALDHDGRLRQKKSDDEAGWSNFFRFPYGAARHELLSGASLRTPDEFWQEPENIWVDVETGNFLGNCRRQVAVAYQGGYPLVPFMDITIYEIGAGFVPIRITSLAESGTWIVPEYPPRITAADVDGDGTDEIAVVYVKREDEPSNDLPGRYYVLQIFDIKYEGDTWKLESLTGPYQYDGIIQADPAVVDAGFAGTLQIASGDINGDGADEVAIISDWVGRDDEFLPFVADDYWIRFLIYYPKTDKSFEDAYHREDIGDFSPDLSEAFLTGVALAAGDVDGDGMDEFVRTWPYDCNGNGIDFGDWPTMERRLEVIKGIEQSSTPKDPEPTCATPDGIDYTYLDRLAVGDVDRDLEDEVVLFGYRRDKNPEASYLEVFNYDKSKSEDNLSPEHAHHWPYWIDWEYVSKTGLALGPLSGESIRVGPPSYRRQYSVGGVTAIINAPPKHIDTLNSVEYNINADDPETKAQLTLGAGQTTHVSLTTTRDWGLAADFSTTIGDAEATHTTNSLKSSYGEHFSKEEGWQTQLEIRQSREASADDALFYIRTDYDVWEYPVLTGNSGTAASYITVVFPASAPRLRVDRGNACDSWYRPRHQLKNVWSYPSSADQLVDRHEGGGGDLVSSSDYLVSSDPSDFSVSFTEVAESKRESGFDLGFSHEFEWQIGGEQLSFDLKFVSFSTRLPSMMFSTKTDYNYSELSRWGVTTTESTEVYGKLNGVPGADTEGYDYAVWPYLYWAEDGYLVLDYTTSPEGTFWTRYDKPDPAFILPWADGHCNTAEDPHTEAFTRDILVDPPAVSSGDPVTITATVRNFSQESNAQSFAVTFYQGDPDSGGIQIGEPQEIEEYELGPRDVKTVTIQWTATGSGDQRIYAVIDRTNQLPEVHDETDPYVNNNKGYGVLHLGAVDFVDMGLASEQIYYSIPYGLNNTMQVSIFVPLGNLAETTRFDFEDTDLQVGGIAGKAFKLVAYRGEEDWDTPEQDFSLQPDADHPPAVMTLSYADGDIAGMDEGNLTLYRLEPDGWKVATCPGYQVQRFPEDNLLAVPLCHTSIFALSDETPYVGLKVFLPLILKSSP